MKAACTLLTAALVSNCVVGAAAAQTIKTKSYTYEWIHLKTAPLSQAKGFLFMEDVSKHHSRIEGRLTDGTTGERILDCSAEGQDFPESSNFDFDIVQVGPFAQQASGDVAANNFIELILDDCGGPQTLTLSCPYQGVPASQSSTHIAIDNKGTFGGTTRDPPATYIQRGHHDIIACDVVIDSVTYQMNGTLTHIRETRQGLSIEAPVARRLTWPGGWITVFDTP